MYMKKYILIYVISIFFLLPSLSSARQIAIIGAMDSEIESFLSVMEKVTKEQYANTTFYKGKLHNKDVIVFKSGIGKVNAAIATTVALEKYDINTIIFTGVAGAVSPDLQITDIVISDYLVQHDYDTTALGTPRGHVPSSTNGRFKADTKLVQIAKESAEKIIGTTKVHIGIIATGDQFIADRKKVQELRVEFNTTAVEMEGASVAQVATLYQIPFVVIRAISDKADGSAHMDYREFEKIAAQNSSRKVKNIVNKL